VFIRIHPRLAKRGNALTLLATKRHKRHNKFARKGVNNSQKRSSIRV
jgi:hypothetical protein